MINQSFMYICWVPAVSSACSYKLLGSSSKLVASMCILDRACLNTSIHTKAHAMSITLHHILYTMAYTTTVASSSLKLSQLSGSKPSFKHK